MKYLKIKEDLTVSRIGFGCMRIGELSVDEVEKLIECAFEQGINFFDHADIYANGNSEKLFGEVLKRHPEWRSKMIIQTKCGIRTCEHTNYYDFSKEHILNSVEGSLKRLNTDYLDVLLLHRPDTLMDPKEIAEAFNELQDSGKVKYFGVSNMNPMQMELLQKHMCQRIMFNQLNFNPIKTGMLSNTLFTNRIEKEAIDHDGAVLDYCRLHDITIQPWSIMQISSKEGTYLNHPNYKELNDLLDEYAQKYKVSKTAIIMAWILRHPAKMQPLFGSTNIHHIKEMCEGINVELSKPEWYSIYVKGLGRKLP